MSSFSITHPTLNPDLQLSPTERLEPKTAPISKPSFDVSDHLDLKGNSALLTINLEPNQLIRAQPEAMVAYKNMTIETEAQGGFFAGLQRAILGGESFFQNKFIAGPSGGWISLAPSIPGDIGHFDLKPNENLFIQNGCYLAASENVDFSTEFAGFKGFLSGTSMFMLAARTTDDKVGRVYFNAFGGILPIEIKPGENITIDNGHIVAFSDNVDYTVESVGSWKSFFFSGEGFVCNFRVKSGYEKGVVYIQTRNLENFAQRIAHMIPSKPQPREHYNQPPVHHPHRY